jgi:hypothetical protein
MFIILAILVAPLSAAQAADEGKSYMTRLTIYNNSQFDFTISLWGGEQYNFTVPPHSDASYLVVRGDYAYTLKSCNHTASGDLDLNIFQIMHVPVCGGNAGGKSKYLHNIDVSKIVKGVNIKIHNQTKEAIGLYLRTTDKHHFLNLAPREVLTLLVLRDTYVYSYVACGELQSGYYAARVNIPLKLTCANK